MHSCRCGLRFSEESVLRQHIALCATGWPAVRCDEVHNDPDNNQDQYYLANKHFNRVMKTFLSNRVH